ncbi:multiple sugar transport system permease protein [Arcanobacterium pluranimalium]|uniref:carbohydrate ABC transporter permease n=1 Tax=Arcanobacterium pluranimalium TaxID=108028 RepID=UPI00195E9CE7|nr:carbohydrate ABC transporter permease [Arcanobacterium pluranimalium]MBM7825169.1 multiple sugar transport system permease protein [Arcanobacterium pluranimalium]
MRKKLRLNRVLGWCTLVFIILITIIPFVWTIRTALTPNSQIFSGDYSLIPPDATWINFKRVLGLVSIEEDLAAGGSGAQMYFWLYLRNSIIFTALLVIGQVITSSMAGYAFARLRFPGREALFAILLTGMMIPPIFIVLPNFVLIKNAGLLNTFTGLLAPYFFVSPFAIFFLRQFFLSIPREVEEAAKLDGAGYWYTFRKIVVPMSATPITTIAIIQAVFAWNEYLWPQLVGKEHTVRLLNVALAAFQQASPSTKPDWAGLMAAATLQMLPMLLVILIFGKKLVGSIGLTSAK